MLIKTVYFLLACDEKTAISFFRKYKFSFQENKSFPSRFIKKSQRAFDNNQISCPPKGDKELLAWKHFCVKSSYEEVLPVILFGILKCPVEQIAWLLTVPPEVLSYRLNQGLLTLEAVLKEDLGKSLGKDFGKTLGKDFDHKEKKALAFCDSLSKKPLPVGLEFTSPSKNWLKKHLLWWCVGGVLCLFLIIWFFKFLLSQPSQIILYPSF